MKKFLLIVTVLIVGVSAFFVYKSGSPNSLPDQENATTPENISGSQNINVADPYPETISWTYNDVSEDLSEDFASPKDIYYHNSKWYVLGWPSWGEGGVIVYDENWNRISSHDLSSQTTAPSSFWRGADGDWYVTAGSYPAKLYQYDSNWTYQNDQTLGRYNPSSISQGKNGNWWLLEISNDQIHKFSRDWESTGETFDVGSQDDGFQDIYRTGDRWWLVGGDSEETGSIYKYDYSWNFEGETQDVSSATDTPIAIDSSSDNLWILSSDKQVYKFD